jgi:hypothetical protein
MAQFPINTPDGLYEAVNYLASGPSGLGQNFQGFSSYTDAYMTGNFRRPYSQVGVAQINVAPIACSAAYELSPRTFKYEFASTQPTPPFALGNNLRGSGWTNDFYNGYQGAIGVVECTTTYVVFQVGAAYPGTGDDLTGGNVFVDNMGIELSTDCNARVTVLGGTDRVFISSQLNNVVSYENPGSASDLAYAVQVNRYKGFINNDPINPDFLFDFDKTIFQEDYNYTGLTGTGTLSNIETIFTTIIDEPEPGYYWYILELMFTVPDGSSLYITTSELGLRSTSVQVVKA